VVTPEPFAAELVVGVGEHLDEIDAVIRAYAQGWTLERMPSIDRALLRIGVFELLHRPDVPTGAVIDEAVALAKEFSTDDSGRFVNGLLSAVAAAERP
jgi:transcription antitermination protein NusB